MYCKEDADSMLVRVKVIPNSQNDVIEGLRGDEALIRIAAQAEKGKANVELLRFLAKELDCPRGDVELVSGETSRHKTIRLSFQAFSRFEKALNRLL